MSNDFYAKPASDATPLSTIRAAQFNSNNEAVETGFDLFPTEDDVKRIQYGTDVSTVSALYEVTIPYLADSTYREGLEVTFKAIFENTGPANISVNGGTNEPILDGTGVALVAGSIKAGQTISVIREPGASGTGFQLLSTVLLQSDIAVAVAAAAAASVSADEAAASAVDTAADLVATNQDTIDTAADLVATNQDTIDTAADLVQTNLDQISCDANATATAADLVATNLDQISCDANATATAADLVATNQDTIDTAADLVQTNLDQISCDTDAAAAAASAASINLPTIDSGDAGKGVEVNGAGTGYDLVPLQTQSFARVVDQKTLGTDGGTFTSGAVRIRDLNTESFDPDNIVTVSTNQFTLQAGTYLIDWSAPSTGVNLNQSLLWNATDSTTEALGSSESNSSHVTRSFGQALVTITSAKAFEIRHECQQTGNNDGFGAAGSFNAEVYTTVNITKVTSS
jgi:hypothetical protein